MTNIQSHYYNLLPLDQLGLKAFTTKTDYPLPPVSLMEQGIFYSINSLSFRFNAANSVLKEYS